MTMRQLRPLFALPTRRWRLSSSVRKRSSASWASPNALFVNESRAPADFEPRSAVVYESLVTKEEGDSLVSDVTSRMRRRRYEGGHWDAVITGYKEVELPDPRTKDADSINVTSPGAPPPLSGPSSDAIERVRRMLEVCHFNEEERSKLHWLPCHAIDLKKDGELTAHVDSVKFSGGIVAGLSLLSPSIMRLKPSSGNGEEDDGPRSGLAQQSPVDAAEQADDRMRVGDCPDGCVDLFLPPLSLYVLSGVSRYRYTHELLPNGSTFGMVDGSNVEVRRERRLSIIFRDAKACD